MKIHYSRPWTPEEDEQIKALAAADKSAMIIAARIKRRMTSVRRRATELGVQIKKRVRPKAAERSIP